MSYFGLMVVGIRCKCCVVYCVVYCVVILNKTSFVQ